MSLALWIFPGCEFLNVHESDQRAPVIFQRTSTLAVVGFNMRISVSAAARWVSLNLVRIVGHGILQLPCAARARANPIREHGGFRE
jgi:hypothetical protein